MSLFRKKKSMPNGLWIRCDSCASVLYKKKLDQTFNVCPECDHHFRIGSNDRLKIMLDDGSFEEYWSSMSSADPLDFVDRIPYKERIVNEQNKTGMKAACVAGKGRMYGKEVMFAVTDPGFVMGSMGSVVGEKITRTAEKALEIQVPLIIVTGSGGGARMQEGVISLMQMAKTSAAIAKLQEAGGLYIIVITDPTLGGVMASFASQADIIIAEPGALIGFAGPRVIEQTIRKSLPPGFQTSEFMLDHGFIDMIVGRNDLKNKVSKLLNSLCEKNTEDEGKIQSENNNNTMALQAATYSNELVAS
ncbi:MAG: acetyl-CoA carboxylase, carboxyltransferase subunit beta [Candidatus Anammoxibacter sp.]